MDVERQNIAGELGSSAGRIAGVHKPDGRLGGLSQDLINLTLRKIGTLCAVVEPIDKI